jgi:adenylate kinase family enzyme
MRIVIIGNSGSGKSTLAAAIASETRWPTLDLDSVVWEPHQIAVRRPEGDVAAELDRFCAGHEHWIVEGCYADLAGLVLEHSPLLIFMDPGMEQCLENCRRRPWEAHKYKSQADQDERLQYLLTWVRDYYTREGPLSLRGHRSLFEGYTGPKRRLDAPLSSVSDVLAGKS